MAAFTLPLLLLIFFAIALPTVSAATSACSSALTPTNGVQPSIASGYQMALVATGLSKPRSIAFDSAGNLLVVQAGKGVSGHKVTDNGGTCISLDSGTMVVGNQDVSNQFSKTVPCAHEGAGNFIWETLPGNVDVIVKTIPC